jgi:hypothetical protein
MIGVSCCHLPVNHDQFRAMALPEQIEAWQRVHREESGLCHVNRMGWLDDIARHGAPAATAMMPFIRGTDTVFPARDAVYVVYAIQLESCDLVDQPPFETLVWAAREHPDPRVRADAARFSEYLLSHAGRKPKCPSS